MTQPVAGAEVSAPKEATHDYFIEAAVEEGIPAEDAENIFKIITEVSPPITVKSVEAFSLPLGDAEIRVAREYDTRNTEDGFDGYTDIILHTPLGSVAYSVERAALVRALTVEVPYVAPQKVSE